MVAKTSHKEATEEADFSVLLFKKASRACNYSHAYIWFFLQFLCIYLLSGVCLLQPLQLLEDKCGMKQLSTFLVKGKVKVNGTVFDVGGKRSAEYWAELCHCAANII